MAAKLIQDVIFEKVGNVTTGYHKCEYLVDSESDVADIPRVAPGSVAYTADLSYMAMYDGEDWVQIGGEE